MEDTSPLPMFSVPVSLDALQDPHTGDSDWSSLDDGEGQVRSAPLASPTKTVQNGGGMVSQRKTEVVLEEGDWVLGRTSLEVHCPHPPVQYSGQP